MLQEKLNELKEAIEALEDGGFDYAAQVLRGKQRELEMQLAGPATL